MTPPRQRGLFFDPATALTLAVTALWVRHQLTLHHQPPQRQVLLLRICGAELGVDSAADELWVCTRPPHPDSEDHRASDGSTWRD